MRRPLSETSPTIRMQLKVPGSTIEAVRREAERSGQTASAWIRSAIAAALEDRRADTVQLGGK